MDVKTINETIELMNGINTQLNYDSTKINNINGNANKINNDLKEADRKIGYMSSYFYGFFDIFYYLFGYNSEIKENKDDIHQIEYDTSLISNNDENVTSKLEKLIEGSKKMGEVLDIQNIALDNLNDKLCNNNTRIVKINKESKKI